MRRFFRKIVIPDSSVGLEEPLNYWLADRARMLRIGKKANTEVVDRWAQTDMPQRACQLMAEAHAVREHLLEFEYTDGPWPQL